MKNEQKITFPEMVEKCVALAVFYHTQRCSAEWKKMRVKGKEKNVTRKLPSTEKYQILQAHNFEGNMQMPDIKRD